MLGFHFLLKKRTRKGRLVQFSSFYAIFSEGQWRIVQNWWIMALPVYLSPFKYQAFACGAVQTRDGCLTQTSCATLLPLDQSIGGQNFFFSYNSLETKILPPKTFYVNLPLVFDAASLSHSHALPIPLTQHRNKRTKRRMITARTLFHTF